MQKRVKTKSILYFVATPGYIYSIRSDDKQRIYLYTDSRHAAILTRCAIAGDGSLIPAWRNEAQGWAMR